MLVRNLWLEIMAALWYSPARCILIYVHESYRAELFSNTQSRRLFLSDIKTVPRLQRKAESLISMSNQTCTKRHIIATMWHRMNVVTLETCYLHNRMRKSLKTTTTFWKSLAFVSWLGNASLCLVHVFKGVQALVISLTGSICLWICKFQTRIWLSLKILMDMNNGQLHTVPSKRVNFSWIVNSGWYF